MFKSPLFRQPPVIVEQGPPSRPRLSMKTSGSRMSRSGPARRRWGCALPLHLSVRAPDETPRPRPPRAARERTHVVLLLPNLDSFPCSSPRPRRQGNVDERRPEWAPRSCCITAVVCVFFILGALSPSGPFAGCSLEEGGTHGVPLPSRPGGGSSCPRPPPNPPLTARPRWRF